MPRLDRLGTTVSLVVLGLLLSMLVPLPSRTIRVVLLGSELSATLSGPALLTLILVAMVSAGVDTVMVTHQAHDALSLGQRVPFWALPSLLVVISIVLLKDFWWGYQIAVIAGSGLLLAVVIISQYHTIDAKDEHHRLCRLILNAIVYATALILFATLYGTQMRSLISATGILLISSMFALELFRGTRENALPIWIYAGVVGLVMGEIMWALNTYRTLDNRIGGAFLLLVFYALTGLIQQYLWERLSRRIVAEFALVCALGLIVLGSLNVSL